MRLATQGLVRVRNVIRIAEMEACTTSYTKVYFELILILICFCINIGYSNNNWQWPIVYLGLGRLFQNQFLISCI